MEPRLIEPLYDKVLGITTLFFFQPDQNYNKMYRTEPRYNEHFACFLKNLLNRGFRYNQPTI